MKTVKNKDGSVTIYPCMESDEDKVELTKEQQLKADKLAKEITLQFNLELIKELKN